MGKGRQYELDTVRALDGHTTDDVSVSALGYSGNAATENADIRIVVNPEMGISSLYDVELKKRTGETGKRIRITGSSTDETGIGEVERLVEECPPFGVPVYVVKFDHREVAVMDAAALLEAVTDGAERKEFLWARETGSGALSIRKPTLDEWPSATSGDADWRKLADVLGLPLGDD